MPIAYYQAACRADGFTGPERAPASPAEPDRLDAYRAAIADREPHASCVTRTTVAGVRLHAGAWWLGKRAPTVDVPVESRREVNAARGYRRGGVAVTARLPQTPRTPVLASAEAIEALFAEAPPLTLVTRDGFPRVSRHDVRLIDADPCDPCRGYYRADGERGPYRHCHGAPHYEVASPSLGNKSGIVEEVVVLCPCWCNPVRV